MLSFFPCPGNTLNTPLHPSIQDTTCPTSRCLLWWVLWWTCGGPSGTVAPLLSFPCLVRPGSPRFDRSDERIPSCPLSNSILFFPWHAPPSCFTQLTQTNSLPDVSDLPSLPQRIALPLLHTSSTTCKLCASSPNFGWGTGSRRLIYCLTILTSILPLTIIPLTRSAPPNQLP